MTTRPCAVEDCTRPHYARTYCNLHYKRHMRGAHVEAQIIIREPYEWGNWYFTADGYIYRRRVLSPDEQSSRSNLSKQVVQGQHRFIMSEFLGRELLPEETVHHKNGVRSDNRIENLELWSSSHPRGQRVKDKVEWAREIIDRYGHLCD